MVYILDTNACRNLVKNISLSEIPDFVKLINEKLELFGHSFSLSTTVSMELISHLVEGDPDREECYKALCLQCFLAHNLDSKSTIDYLPPMDIILAKYFFDLNPDTIGLYELVISLTYEITSLMNLNLIGKYIDQIIIIKKQVAFDKNEFKANVEMYLKSINNEDLDWSFFKKNKTQRKIFYHLLNSKKINQILAISLINRAQSVVKLNELDIENRLSKFIDDFLPALNMHLPILENLGQGSTKLEQLTSEKWNTINDISILFGVLYENSLTKEKTLITDDKQILNSCKGTRFKDCVIDLSEFKKQYKLV